MKKAGEIIYRLEAVISGAALVVMIFCTVGNVCARYILNHSFLAAEELTYLAFNWAVYFGLCIVYRNQALVAIDVIVDRLPEKVRHVIQIITFALVGLTNAALVIWGFRLAVSSFTRVTPALRLPYFWMYICIPVACLILCIYSFHNMVTVLRGGVVESASLELRS